MIVIKIGGAIISPKSGSPALRTDAIRATAAALADSGEPTVVIHGAGGYGRSLIPLFDDGWRCTDFHRGIVLQRALATMTGMVAEALMAGGLRPLAVPLELLFGPSPTEQISREPGGSVLESTIALGRQPLLGGGARWMPPGEFRLCSSDLITARAAQVLQPRRVVFLSDVAGVEDENGRVIGVLDPERATHVARPTHDVTGAMRDKLAYAVELARCGIETVITDGRESSAIRDALGAHRPSSGTVVVAERASAR